MYTLSPDRLTTAAGSAVPNSMCQDAEDGYLVFHGCKKGVQAELVGERDPVLGPEAILGGGTRRETARRAVVTADRWSAAKAIRAAGVASAKAVCGKQQNQGRQEGHR